MTTGRNGWMRAAALAVGALSLVATASRADEIRLKDGKKLYGVIVAYEDNMFKVKTDFGGGGSTATSAKGRARLEPRGNSRESLYQSRVRLPHV